MSSGCAHALRCSRYAALIDGRQLSPGDRADSIASASDVASKGFFRNATAPSFFARSRSAGFSLEVMKMIGVAADPLRFCSRSATKNPSPAGSEISRTTTSGWFLRTADTALTASLAVYTVYPMLLRRTPMPSRIVLSSSTSNTDFINSFLEAADCSNSSDGSDRSLMQSSADLHFVQDLVRICEQKEFFVIRGDLCGAPLQLVRVSVSLDSIA